MLSLGNVDFQPLPSKGRIYFLNSEIWVWPCNLFWLKGFRRSGTMSVLSLGPKGFAFFLELGHQLMKKPRLASWRMRHMAQSSPLPQTS